MTDINIPGAVGNIKNWDTLIFLAIAAISGMLGGIAHRSTSPPDDRTSWWSNLVVGAVASLAVLFVFTPSDAVRLIALSLIAGYGGKAILDALEAKVKTAIAEAETVKVKDDGKETTKAGKEIGSIAQKLLQINKELEKNLMEAKGQPREAIYEGLPPLPVDLQSFAAKSPEDVTDELKQLFNKLDFLEKSFEK